MARTQGEVGGPQPWLGKHLEPRAKRRLLPRLGRWVAGTLIVAAAVWLSVVVANAYDPLRVPMLLTGGAVVALLAGLALFRFHHFVLAVLVLRSSLDLAKTGEGTGALDPTSLVSLAFMAAAVLWLLARRRVVPGLRSPLHVAVVAFLFACLLSAIGSERPLTSLVDLSRLASWGLMFLVLDELLETRRHVLQLLVAVALSCVLPLVLGFVGVTSGQAGPLMELKGSLLRVTSTFDASNSFARYLMVLLLMAWAVQALLPQVPRAFVLVGSLAATVMLVLTYTRTAWLGLALGLVVIGVLQSRKLLVGLLVTAAILLVAVPPVNQRVVETFNASSEYEDGDGSLSWRLSYWGEVLPLVTDNPITGIGLGVTGFRTEAAKAPHNDYLRFLVEAGIVGLAAYVGFLFALLTTAVQAMRGRPRGFTRSVGVGFAACVLATLVTSVGANVSSDITFMWYLITFAAVVTSANRLEGDPGRSVCSQVSDVSDGEQGTKGRDRVEIVDYLKMLKSRLVLLVSIPLFAAAAMAGVSYSLEPAFSAHALVAVPPQETTSREVDQTIQNYLAAASTPLVLEEVAQATGVSVSRLRRDLSLQRLDESSFIEISFASTDPQEPPAVVQASGRATALFLLKRELREARQPVDEAAAIYDAAEESIQRFVQPMGGAAVSISELFRQRQAELSTLRVSRADALASGAASTVVENLNKIIAEREEELRNLGPLAVITELPSVIEATEQSTPLPRLPTIVRRVIAAAGAGLVIAIGLVVLLELAAARRRARRARRARRRSEAAKARASSRGTRKKRRRKAGSEESDSPLREPEEMLAREPGTPLV